MDQRIFGLETEFAISYEPETRPGENPPRRKELFKIFREVLRTRYALFPALYKKEGDFVENGSLLHYEAQIQHYQDGLIEWATPECADPMEALVYSKAQEEALLETQQACRDELHNRGFLGALRVLKNNVDFDGNNYGCHENYLVTDVRPWWLNAIKTVCFGLFWVLFLPFWLLPRVVFVLFLTLLLVMFLVYLVVHLIARLPLLGWVADPLVTRMDTALARYGSRLDEQLIKHLALFMEVLYLPFVHLYSVFCRQFVFERYQRLLTTFLVTRQLYTGTGRIHPTDDGELFWLSQKAEFVRYLTRVFWNQRYKPIFDIKNYLMEPLTFFGRYKRLHLLIGDSNLAEVSEYLKLAATGLVIQLIEEADRPDLPRLVDPIGAIRMIATDPELTRTHACRDGEHRTAIQIQRAYLSAVREHLAQRGTMPIWGHTAMTLWEGVLDRLETTPGSLHTEVDWMIKRRLMDQLMWGRSDWAEMRAWAPVLAVLTRAGVGEIADGEPAGQVAALRDLLEQADRSRLDELLADPGRDPARLPGLLAVFLELKKIDLKYHELSPEGYCQVLKEQGLVRRLSSANAVDLAKTEPPLRTRARVRGQFIKLANRRKLTAFVGWSKIKTYNPRRVIHMREPFGTDIEPLSTLR